MEKNITIHRTTSQDLAKKWTLPLKALWIDGDHSYEAVINDLYAYYPKLKKFGVLCGDDYGHPSGLGVIQAVQEFSIEKQLLVNYREDNQFWMIKTAL